jgi:hypothetical protein
MDRRVEIEVMDNADTGALVASTNTPMIEYLLFIT